MIDYQLEGKNLIISYYNDNGQIDFLRIRIPDKQMYKWALSNQPSKNLNQDGNPITKRRGSINRHRVMEILHSLPDNIKNKVNKIPNARLSFCDIETEVLDDEFPDVNNPEGRVLTNAFCSISGNVAYIQTLKQLTTDQIKSIEASVNKDIAKFGQEYKVKNLYYNSEKEMITHFMKSIVPQMHGISGWNFIKFDWAYLMGRARKLGIDTKCTSKTKVLDTVVIRDKYNRDKVTKVSVPKHRPIIDYMEIWEKWDTKVKLKSSSGLDYVAGEALGVKKVQYSGTLMDLYNNDFERFCYYNIIDTILVKLLHQELATFGTMGSISQESFTPLSSALYASQVLEPMFQYEYMQKGIHLAVDYNKRIDSSKYSGGFVLEPGKGIKEGVTVYDFESLFPTIIMLLNIGADTYIGDICEDDPGYYIDLDGNRCELNLEEHSYSALGTVFTKKEKSIPAKIVWKLFGGRIADKSKANQIQSEIGRLKQML